MIDKTNITLKADDVPKQYAVCYNHECPRAGERHSYTIPSDVAKWIKDHGEGPYLTRVMRDIMSKA